MPIGFANRDLVHLTTCYHVKSGSSVTKVVRINRKELQNCEELGPCSFGGGGVTNHLQPPPHICYHVKLGRSASNGVCINIREFK